MNTLTKSAISLNQAIDSNVRDRDSTNRKCKQSHDKYQVTIKDDKGQEYTIKYYF